MMDMVPVYTFREQKKYGLLNTRWQPTVVWASGWAHNEMDLLSETFVHPREVDYVIPREYML